MPSRNPSSLHGPLFEFADIAFALFSFNPTISNDPVRQQRRPGGAGTPVAPVAFAADRVPPAFESPPFSASSPAELLPGPTKTQ